MIKRKTAEKMLHIFSAVFLDIFYYRYILIYENKILIMTIGPCTGESTDSIEQLLGSQEVLTKNSLNPKELWEQKNKKLFEVSSGLSNLPTEETRRQKIRERLSAERRYKEEKAEETEEDVNLEFPLAYTMPK